MVHQQEFKQFACVDMNVASVFANKWALNCIKTVKLMKIKWWV